MRLLPRHPPGRASRKALAFAAEIRSLRAAGYSLAAIREALADAGVDVSLSTVRREAARRPIGADQAVIATPPPRALVATGTPLAVTADARSGREIAESFVKNRVSNPLIRARSKP